MTNQIKKSRCFVPKFTPAGLCLLLGLAAGSAQAQTEYFGVTSGIVNGNTYSWDDPNWSTSSGGPYTASWGAGGFAEFKAANNYTVTVNADELNAGLYQDGGSASALTINDAGNSTGDLDVAAASGLSQGLPVQGFLVASGDSLTINCPIVGSGGIAPESSGSLYLYGNNTYSGGTALGVSGSTLTFINNNNSFGTGPVSVGRGVGVYAAILATAPVTLANNFQNTSAGDGFNFASSANSPVTLNGNMSLGTFSLNLRNNGNSTSPLTLNGNITGTTAGLTLSGANGGAILMNGSSTYTGPTTIGVSGASAITLQLGAPNAFASSSSIIMAGGTLNPEGIFQTMPTTTLGLTANSIIDFTAGDAAVSFANSASVPWSGTLNILSYDTGDLQFGSDNTGLTSAQLSDIDFNGAAGLAALDSSGFLIEVPEPSTWVLGVIGGLGMIWRARRQTA